MSSITTNRVVSPSMSSQVNIALDQLDKHKLNEAEKSFLRILSSVEHSAKDRDQNIIRSFDSLGDINFKKARHARGTPQEWHWRCLQALAFYYKALEHCEKTLHSEHFNNDVYNWLQEEKAKIQMHHDKVEEIVLKSIQKELLGRSSETKHVKSMSLDRVLEIYWLQSLKKYCSERQRHHVDNLQVPEGNSDTESDKDSFEEIKEKREKTEKEKVQTDSDPKSKINFTKIQNAVQKLARQISHEVRYRQKMGLSPYSLEHTIDIDKIQEDSDEEAEVFPDEPSMDVQSPRITPEKSSPKHSKTGIDPEYSWQEDRFDSLVKYTVRGERETLPFEPKGRSNIPITGEPLLVSKRKSSLTDRLPVVLTVWEAYQQPLPSTQRTLPISHHRQEAFEELSPVAEVIRLPGQKFRTLEIQSLNEPVSEGSIILALARVLCQMMKQWGLEKRVLAASEILKFTVGLLKDIPPEENPNKCLAEALTLYGSVKCKLGDIIGGTQLMEKAIKIYENSSSPDAIYCIAEVWFEMGDAFIAEQLDHGALYDLVMKSVREGLENESHADDEMVHDSDSDSSDDEEDSKSEQEYFINVHEAVDCYTEALNILRQIPKGNKENRLYADVQSKIGDCSIMAGNYDKAVECYEEAMRLCKHSVGSESLPNNAHALLMMGMSNYVLGNYPKAVRMFETAQLIQQHLHGTDTPSFERAFNYTMMGISNFLMKQHHKCIVWCLKAFEMYTNIYRNKIAKAEEQKVWFIANTLYYLGHSYSTINLYDKALHYLELSQYLIMKADQKCIKQLVKTLKGMADIYSVNDEHGKALKLYNEAYDYSMSIGDESSALTLQNQLLNRMAGVHVSTKQYSEAAVYLEQALDHQKTVESGIKGDLISVMFQLGITYTLAGDLDRAIDCFGECLESYQEIDGSPDGGMSQTLCNLATLNHVKSCMQDETEDILHFENLAETYFQSAYDLEPESSIGAKYANYLYQQGSYADALEVLLPMLHPNFQPEEASLCYRGVEQAILPEQLQLEIDDVDEALIDFKIFCYFIAILCFRQLRLTKDADVCMMELFKLVMASSIPLNTSILGYTFMEMDLYPEAAETFSEVASMSADQSLAITNMKLCYMTWIYIVYIRALSFYYDFCQSFVIKSNLLAVEEADRKKREIQATKAKEEEMLPVKSPMSKVVRDSGYYGLKVENLMEKYKHELKSKLDVSDYSTRTARMSWPGSDLSDKGYTSNETLASIDSKDELFRDLEEQGTPKDVIKSALNRHKKDMVAMRASESTEDLHRFASVSTLVDRSYESQQNLHDEETWQTYEETVETPAAILQSGSMRDLSSVEKHDETHTRPKGFISESQSMRELRFTGQSDSALKLATPDETEEWTTSEEVVETPVSILNALESGTESAAGSSKTGTSPNKNQPDTWSINSRPMSLPTSPDYNTGFQSSIASHDYDKTPTRNNISISSYYSEPEEESRVTNEQFYNYGISTKASSKYDNVFTSTPTKTIESPLETWQTEETVVDTPIELLEILANQGLRAAEEAYSALAPEEQEKIMNAVSDVDETWTVEEEVVETPQAVLDHVRKSSSSSESKSSGNHGYNKNSVSYQSYTSPSKVQTQNYPTFAYTQEKHMTSSEDGRRYPYSNYSSYRSNKIEQTPDIETTKTATHYTSYRSNKVESPVEEKSWTSTEETVTTPREIIDMIKTKSTVDPVDNSKFQYESSESNVNRYGYTDNKQYGSSWRQDRTPSVETMNETNRRYIAKEDSTEIWETEEETVETPAAILQALRAAQN